MNEMMNVGNMSLEQLTELNSQVMLARVNIMQEKMKQMELDRNKETTVLKMKLEQIEENQGNVIGITDNLKEEIEQAKMIQIASTRVRRPRYEYVSQGEFGIQFNVTISSVRVGKLLKIIGLAQPSKGKLVPYRQYVNSKYAIKKDDEKYTHHYWHFQKCLKKMDKWLEDNNHLTNFYSITDNKELDKFIDGLYTTYIIEKGYN